MKQSFSQNPDLLPCFAKLEAGAFRLQIALAFAVDSGGRLPAEPSFLKNYLFPLSTERITLQSIQEDLSALVKCGNVILFEEGGVKYLVLLCLSQLRGGKRPVYPAPTGRSSKWIPTEDDYLIHKSQMAVGLSNPALVTSSEEIMSDDKITVPFNLPYAPDQVDASPETTTSSSTLGHNEDQGSDSSQNQTSAKQGGVKDEVNEPSTTMPAATASTIDQFSHPVEERYPTREELRAFAPSFPEVRDYGSAMGATPLWNQTWFRDYSKNNWAWFTINKLKNWRDVMKNDFKQFCKSDQFSTPQRFI